MARIVWADLTEEQRRQILDDHRRWKNGDGGARAYLDGADLRGAYLARADLARADLRGAYLDGADLRGAYLARADLAGADLRGAYLAGAYLAGAYLAGANLARAYLGGANLGGAYLARAYLGGANLARADLAGARLSWTSHALLSEILWRAADTEPRRMLAAYVGRCTDRCWEGWEEWEHPEREWALRELAEWVQDGDDAPALVREAKAAEVQP